MTDKKKWIQEAVSKMKNGSFSKAAKKKKESTSQYAKEVLANPDAKTKLKRRAVLAQTFARIAKKRKG